MSFIPNINQPTLGNQTRYSCKSTYSCKSKSVLAMKPEAIYTI